jgi:serine/threonine protein kinase
MALKAAQRSIQTVGGYAIVQRLAKTRMSTVYKARCPTTGEVVVVKLAGDEPMRDPVIRKRFEQEFTVTRSLSHPHLVRMLRFGHEGATPYIVMEFVEGRNLGDRIQRERRLPEAEALRIILQTAEALDYAHKNGVIHRDVKPDNILLGSDGRAKLTDLGLAKDADAVTNLTQASEGLGTPNFMAPEQFNDAKHADPRCDVYSLGATLYMAITGELPFRAHGVMGVLKKKLNNDIVPPRKLVPRISPWVESVICRSMDVNPRGRPASCREFIEELSGENLQSMCGEPAKPGGTSARTQADAASFRSILDRRATVRYPSNKACPCRALSTEQNATWPAELKDVSADGVGLIMKRRFEPRTVLLLEFPGSENASIRQLLIRVVRVQAASGRRWLLGCVFARRLGEEELKTLF